MIQVHFNCPSYSSELVHDKILSCLSFITYQTSFIWEHTDGSLYKTGHCPLPCHKVHWSTPIITNIICTESIRRNARYSLSLTEIRELILAILVRARNRRFHVNEWCDSQELTTALLANSEWHLLSNHTYTLYMMRHNFQFLLIIEFPKFSHLSHSHSFPRWLCVVMGKPEYMSLYLICWCLSVNQHFK